jgi:hypothetical protein
LGEDTGRGLADSAGTPENPLILPGGETIPSEVRVLTSEVASTQADTDGKAFYWFKTATERNAYPSLFVSLPA